MNENPFDTIASEYEAWFVENKVLFHSELLALKRVVPVDKKGVEIGIGSGIFAEQLGIRYGIDPSETMLEYARQRGLEVQNGVAENLPYENESFDFAVLVNSICFIDNPELAATNLITAIADAKLDSVPVVAFTGQVASSFIGTDAFQEIDTYGLTMSITKHNFLVRSIHECTWA